MTYICQCGCGQEIPFSKMHGRRYEPKYLRGHGPKSPASAERVAQKRAERLAELPTLICQCGCGQPIPPKPDHRYNPPKYILAHYLKIGTHQRIIRLREERAKARMAPPPDWTPPSGICECGCRRPTKIATVSRPERHQYNGFPLRFLNGHARTREIHPLAEAGRWRTKDGYVMVYVHGDPRTYVPEHRLMYEQSRGITLPSGVDVHHINGIRDDNRPENLIATVRGAHKVLHVKAGEIVALFLDDRLLTAAREHVRQHGELPDLAELTQQLYVQPETHREPAKSP